MTIRVMTFNVRGSFHDDAANDWDKRRDLNIATIQKYAPDVIGFQEAQQGNIDDYARMLAGYDKELGYISIRTTQRYHQIPIYWKADRFEKINMGGFYLSETPDEWSIGWQSTLVRAVTWVVLCDLSSNSEFLVLNTHFPHERDADETRKHCADLIVAQLEQIAPNTPQIVMADFNTQPSSDAYQAFMQAGFVDTYTASGSTHSVNTFHGFMGDDFEWQSGRIDWIFTKDGTQTFTAQSCEVITDAEPPIYPSDHYPVIADLDIV
ncbi:MAG: endonuclease/exonuclease/phosphatase family protein [Chloroflexota bacterium]